MGRWLLWVLLLSQVGGKGLFAQADTTWTDPPAFLISAFVNVYYCYDFNQPETNQRQSFLFHFNRHNEFNVNMAYLRMAVEHPRYRANLALQTGTYPIDNYSQEPDFLRNIYEAYAGVSLEKTRRLWLDLGVFSSHLGFESAVAQGNWTLTQSLFAENSPYYLAGAKLTWYPNANWTLTALVCNGWQRIQRVSGNSLLSFGSQLIYRAGDQWMFNWSTFVGTDDPDDSRRMRYFTDIHGEVQLSPSWQLIAGIDLGWQQRAKGSTNYHFWYTPTLITQYSISSRWQTAFRIEYYADEAGVIVPNANGNPFQTLGLSLNLDFMPITSISCRVEGRWFQNQAPYFAVENGFSRQNFFVTASFAVELEKVFDL